MVERIAGFVISVALLANASIALWSRRMIGFPDGFRGPADVWLDGAYLVSALCSVGIAVLVGVDLLRSRAVGRRRWLLIVALAGGFLFVATLAAEPVARTLLPSTGG